MEEQRRQYAKVKRAMEETERELSWLKQKVELIQRPAFDLGLNDGWAVHIDIVVMGECKRFATVYGKDKFEAQLNASAICRIDEL